MVNTHKRTHAHKILLPNHSDQHSSTVPDNSACHGTWVAGCPQCNSTQSQDDLTGFLCASPSSTMTLTNSFLGGFIHVLRLREVFFCQELCNTLFWFNFMIFKEQ